MTIERRPVETPTSDTAPGLGVCGVRAIALRLVGN